MIEQGPIIAFALVDPFFDIPDKNSNNKSAEDDQNDGQAVENPPLEQPDVDPLKRENPDIDDVEENQPIEQPEIDEMENPQPDLDEIDQNEEPEINELSDSESNIDRDPIVQPGTDPMKTDNSQVI